MGIRLALGATPQSVQLLVIKRGVALAGLGMTIGLAGSLALRQALTTCYPRSHPARSLEFRHRCVSSCGGNDRRLCRTGMASLLC